MRDNYSYSKKTGTATAHEGWLHGLGAHGLIILLWVGCVASATASTIAVDDDIDSKRRYDQVTFVTTHNAFAASADGWLYAQQGLSIPMQLQLGVRGLMLDLHMGQGGVVEKQCHDVQKQVSNTQQQCTKTTRQDCHQEKVIEDQCHDVSKKICKNVPWPINYACDWTTERVCDPVEVLKTVCDNVDDLVCSPVTVVELVTESVCDVANVIPSGDKTVRLCHEADKNSNCLLTRTVEAPGQVPHTLASALTDVKKFLDSNRKAVVTIFFESYIGDHAKIQSEFAASGINSYVFDTKSWFASNSAWPTIQTLRDKNMRLLVFTDNSSDGFPVTWDYFIETQYNLAKYPNCELRTEAKDISNSKKTLLTINHFYEYAAGQPYVPVVGEMLNNPVQIGQRILKCQQDTGRTVNFLALDFVEKAPGVWPIIKMWNTGPR